jgi:hypothetical protein
MFCHGSRDADARRALRGSGKASAPCRGALFVRHAAPHQPSAGIGAGRQLPRAAAGVVAPMLSCYDCLFRHPKRF